MFSGKLIQKKLDKFDKSRTKKLSNKKKRTTTSPDREENVHQEGGKQSSKKAKVTRADGKVKAVDINTNDSPKVVRSMQSKNTTFVAKKKKSGNLKNAKPLSLKNKKKLENTCSSQMENPASKSNKNVKKKKPNKKKTERNTDKSDTKRKRRGATKKVGAAGQRTSSSSVEERQSESAYYSLGKGIAHLSIYQESDADEYPVTCDWLDTGEETNTPQTNSTNKKHKDSHVFARKKENIDHKEQRKIELAHKLKLIGDTVGEMRTGKDTVVAALASGSTLYVHGMVCVCPLVGTVQVLGYTIQQGEVQALYSLASGALPGITPVNTHNIVASDAQLQKKGVNATWIDTVTSKHAGPLVILEVKRYNPPLARLLCRVGWSRLFRSTKWQQPWESVGATVINELNCQNFNLIEEGPQWREIVDNINSCWTCGSVPRVVVCGGKGVGKSTFFRYLINTLLTNKADPSIVCLDLDLGQSEFSLPTCVSLIRLTKPLLGPAYALQITECAPYVKQVLVGATSPQFMLQRYLAAVRYLHQLSLQHPTLPLVVNTMGWTQGTGLSIMLDVLRVIEPTHVIQIQSPHHKNNYDIELSSKAVVGARGGITTQAYKSELHYSLQVMLTATSGHKGFHSFSPKILRELAVLSHVGQFLDRQHQEMEDTAQKSYETVKLLWTSVVLHVCDQDVPRERVLQVMNGQLVALCQVSSDNIVTIAPHLPKHLIEDSSFGELVGWAVIRSINPLARELSLLTSLQPQDVITRVNAVMMPKLYLPDSLYKIYSSREAPYLQIESRTGAARLKVNRQIKPRGHR